MAINAYAVEKHGKSIQVMNSDGLCFASPYLSEVLRCIAQSGIEYNVVWDSADFWKPILTMLPKDKASALADGKAVYYDGIRLWWGITRHGRASGIRYKGTKHISGNLYEPIHHEIEIAELKQYFSESEKPKDLPGLAILGEKLIKTLSNMSLNPKSIISAAGIYKECVLDKMNIPCIFTMPGDTWPAHEMAFDCVNEWVSNYKSKPDDGLYSYDLTAAYAWALSELPNLAYAEIIRAEEEDAEERLMDPYCYWGVVKGIINNKMLISPMVKPETGRSYIGFWEDTVTTDLLSPLYQYGVADFDVKEGWFIYLKNDYRLFDYGMKKLYAHRNGNELENNLAKAMAVSTWGKMLETRGDDFGDLFNAIYGSMVVNKIKARVLDFIYQKKLQDSLVSVNVDGVKCTKKLDITTERRFGEWRLVK